MLDVARCLTAGLVSGAFFLPWVEGGGPFASRTFSGFELARIARDLNEAISIEGPRALAISLYLVPALALNALFLVLAARFLALPRAAASIASVSGGLYAGFSALTVILFLRHSTVLGYAIGHAEPGLFLNLVAGLSLAVLGLVPSGNR